MLYFRVRNFEQFQHYKHRNPPWIRLYYQLLNDRRFWRLDDQTKWLAVGCFLLASQCENRIPLDEEWIQKQLSLTTIPNWQALLDAEVIQPIDCDASTLLAACKHYASQSITDNSEYRTDNTEAEILSISPKDPKSSGRGAGSKDLYGSPSGNGGEPAATPDYGIKAKSSKQIILEASEIFRFWNSQPATMHHRSVNGQEKAISLTLRKYEPAEIRRAIERYSIVRQNAEGKYRDLYVWTLGEFLTRQDHYNIERFNAQDWELPFLAQPGGSGGTKKPGSSRLATDEDKRNYNPNERNN